MVAFLTSPGLWPFTLALCLLVALMLVELFMMLVGVSMLSADVDGPELDADIDLDADLELDAELGADGAEAGGGVSAWLGLGRVPLAFWVASALTGFGVSGYVIQSLMSGAVGGVLPAMLAVPAAIPPTVFFAKFVSGWLGRVLPKTESSALTERGLTGLHGTITQGTAKPGVPAEVRVKDRHGNTHYLRLEPYEDVALPQGSDVTVVRRDGKLRALGLSDS